MGVGSAINAKGPPMSHPETYSRNQLIAHWLVVLFVLIQFLLNGSMERAFGQAVEIGAFPLNGGALMHALGGGAIFCLMVWRLSMRLTHGAPPPSEAEPRPIQFVSRANHWAFYVVLLAMPLVGLGAVLTISPTLAMIHSWTSTVLLILIALHLAGAIWHMVRPNSDAWRRMLRRDPATRI